jgi:mono/diheme cytochrome c family protein
MQVRSTLHIRISLFALVAAAACSSQAASSATASPQPQAAMAVAALPAGVTNAMVALGDSIFHKASCQRCHGMDAKGTDRGPDLTDATWAQISGSYPEIVKVITEGVPKDKIKMPGAPFAMRPKGGVNPPLTDDQVNAVAAYVYTISHR